MDDVKGGIAKAAKAITKGSGTFIKTTRLTISLHNEEANLKSLYIDIGKKVHEIYQYGGSLGEFFDAKYQEVVEVQNKIDGIKSQIDVAKGVISCPKCGKASPRTSVYCPKCGESMTAAPELATQPAQIEEPPPPARKEKTCAICGAVNDQQDRFCLSCGRMI